MASEQSTADVDRLPPTQYLVMEVLAARYRTGETFWTFPTSCGLAIQALAEKGLVWSDSSPTPGTVRVWLTEAGRAAATGEGFQLPVERERARVVAERDRLEYENGCMRRERERGARYLAKANRRFEQAERELDVRRAAEEAAAVIDAAHIARQRAWSECTFGPGIRRGVIDHIRKELVEVEESGLTNLGEWVDVIILGFDGAWRAGHEPQAIIDAIKAKQARNEARTWPDWRTADRDIAIEHDRQVGDA